MGKIPILRLSIVTSSNRTLANGYIKLLFLFARELSNKINALSCLKRVRSICAYCGSVFLIPTNEVVAGDSRSNNGNSIALGILATAVQHTSV